MFGKETGDGGGRGDDCGGQSGGALFTCKAELASFGVKTK